MFDGPTAAWHASLALRVRSVGGRSLLAARHRGPLRVQKALYPEGAAPCHAVVLHPPGGIAGGDALEISVSVDAGAHALVTTPGAAKWYKSLGPVARQQVRLDLDGALEWLPQEAIVFDAANVRSTIDVQMNDGASMIGWDIVALGRRAAGERFERGLYAQTIRLRMGTELAWMERTRLAGNDALLESPVGLAGHHVFGCLWAAGPAFDDATMEGLRAALAEKVPAAPLTRLTPRLVVARALGPNTHFVRAALTEVWAALRPLVFGRAAVPPRLWAT
ncbi:MAG: urease accessory protein UreD [Burkholderiaceae bacterium]